MFCLMNNTRAITIAESETIVDALRAKAALLNSIADKRGTGKGDAAWMRAKASDIVALANAIEASQSIVLTIPA